jgi:hypothetical protein
MPARVLPLSRAVLLFPPPPPVLAAETLVVLDLCNNSLNDDMARMLASGLADNISVTHLNLSHNSISGTASSCMNVNRLFLLVVQEEIWAYTCQRGIVSCHSKVAHHQRVHRRSSWVTSHAADMANAAWLSKARPTCCYCPHT